MKCRKCDSKDLSSSYLHSEYIQVSLFRSMVSNYGEPAQKGGCTNVDPPRRLKTKGGRP